MRNITRGTSILLAILTLSLPVAASAQSDIVGQFSLNGASITAHQTFATDRVSDATDIPWWYGCSPTAVGMMIGHYDRIGYGSDPLHNKYPSLVPGGVAELTTYGNPGALVNAATASTGHISDFYRNGYMSTGDDLAQPWHSFNSLADFMGTSQDAYGNVNGSTTFYNYTNGARLYARDAYTGGFWAADGMYGVAEYVNYCGYGSGNPATDTNFFSQYIYGLNGNTRGFTWANYMTEIDAGRPVIIQVEGHSMFGYGYDNTGGAQTVLLHDTWTAGEHTMTWGGSYAGMTHYGVMAATLTNGVPEPATMSLLALGGMATLIRRRRNRR